MYQNQKELPSKKIDFTFLKTVHEKCTFHRLKISQVFFAP